MLKYEKRVQSLYEWVLPHSSVTKYFIKRYLLILKQKNHLRHIQVYKKIKQL